MDDEGPAAGGGGADALRMDERSLAKGDASTTELDPQGLCTYIYTYICICMSVVNKFGCM